MIWMREKYNMVWNGKGEVQDALDGSVRRIIDTVTTLRDTTMCHSNNMVLKRAARCHSVTADSLCSYSAYITSEQHRDRTGTHSPPCYSLATLRHAWRHKQSHIVPCACHLVMSGNTPSPARTMQSHARRCLVPAGGYRTILHGLLCAVTKCFSPSYRVTPTKDLCVLFLLAVSNHSPAVWFIQTASVISVKCSA